MIRRDVPVYRFAPRFATQTGVSLPPGPVTAGESHAHSPAANRRRIEPVTWTSGYTGVMGHPQHVLLFANGAQVAAWAIPNQVPATLRATIPLAALSPGPVVLRLAVAAPARPSNFGIISDTRQLGVFLTSVKLSPLSH